MLYQVNVVSSKYCIKQMLYQVNVVSSNRLQIIYSLPCSKVKAFSSTSFGNRGNLSCCKPG